MHALYIWTLYNNLDSMLNFHWKKDVNDMLFFSGNEIFLYLNLVLRLVGVFRMVLQKLIQDGSVEVKESLVDSNNTVLKVITWT